LPNKNQLYHLFHLQKELNFHYLFLTQLRLMILDTCCLQLLTIFQLYPLYRLLHIHCLLQLIMRQQQRQFRLALAFPRELESAQEDVCVALPAASEWSRLSWPCVPRKRGNYRLGAVHVEGASWLGFWAGRQVLGHAAR
jgi:hypothetical protein